MARQYGSPPTAKWNAEDDRSRYTPERKDAEAVTREPESSPSNLAVTAFHKNASVDTRPEDIHHRLGSGPNSAASGAHTHNGSDSPLILSGMVITGSKASPSTVLPSIISALKRLGATDSTT